MRYTLEILAYNLEACAIAEAAGADRIELCDNPGQGGTTPSYGTIRAALGMSSIPVFPMIRPRGGDFLYSDAEFSAMQDDIRVCRQLGAEGVVLGILKANGSIDTDRTARLVELAYPMEVTFHRAFDHCRDPLEALEAIIGCGCSRILTSGQQPQATEGTELIKTLVEKAEDRITIMPGAGIRQANLQSLLQTTGATEFHSSAGILTAGGMQFTRPDFAGENSLQLPDHGAVAAMKAILRQFGDQATDNSVITD
jgi:copper homeostasis protein